MVKHPDIRAGLAPRVVFHIDGVRRDPGEGAVLEPKRRDAFVGNIPWTLELARSVVRLPASIVELGTAAIVRQAGADAWLAALRPLLLHAQGCPRFVLRTITRIGVTPTRVRLFGMCAPLMSDALGPGYRGDLTRR